MTLQTRDESLRFKFVKLFLAALASALILPLATPSGVAQAAPAGDEQVVAFEVRGVGNGHGRGMSQWGAYGRALAGQSWEQILAAYYGGTAPGVRTKPDLRVRLTEWDGTPSIGVISRSGSARWNTSSTGYTSLYATETSPDRFSVFGVTSGFGCPGGLDLVVPFVDLQIGSEGELVRQVQEFLTYFGYNPGGVDGDYGPLTAGAVQRFQIAASLGIDGRWGNDEATAAQAMVDAAPGVDWGEPLASNVRGPIVFSTTVDESTSGAGDGLGLCRDSGSVRHYRGSIELRDVSGSNRVVNQLDVENYLRGVLPKEVSDSWGDDGGGKGMNALRAQAVAARSYGLSQSRYSYASTCDTTSCQVYAGSATRSAPSAAGWTAVEGAFTDQAIRDTVGVVRVWPSDNEVASTEFSASNGPRTAGGYPRQLDDPASERFAAVDDPLDDIPQNPNHRWVRIIDADDVRAEYQLASANGVRTAVDADSPYDGIWANEVVLGEGKSPVSAWAFRNDFGLPSPGFELIPIRRTLTAAGSFAFIGDSVGVTIATSGSGFQAMTEGVFSAARFDAVSSRRTQGGTIPDGVGAAKLVPVGTDLVVVELGYNDTPSAMGSRIDAVMTELRARDVGRVAWVTVSERKSSAGYGVANAAITAAAGRWNELVVLDWESASDDPIADRWYSSDGVHLTTSGNAEFALWLRDRVVEMLSDGYTPPAVPRQLYPNVPLRVPVLGVGGVPASGVTGVALNVTAVNPTSRGWIRVWPCGSPQPTTSSVNFLSAGAVEPNAVLVPVDATGEVCVMSLVATDVIVDVSAWFEAGLRSATGRLVDTRESNDRLVKNQVFRVPVLNREGVPASGVTGVALNVTAVNPAGRGWIRVWPCGSPQPTTSSVNFLSAGAVEPNAVLVPVDATGEVCVMSIQDTDLVVDVSAWFEAGVHGATGRLVDTRESNDRLVKNQVFRVPVLNREGVPASGVTGVALNVTAVNPAGRGWIRVWPCGSPQPTTSSVNFLSAGAVEPNAVLVPVDATGEVCVTSIQDTDLVVDVSAWFDAGLRGIPGDRIVDTRKGIGPIPTR